MKTQITLNELQQKIIKNALISKMSSLVQEQDSLFESAELDTDDTQRIITIQNLHFVNSQIVAIKEVDNQLSVKDFGKHSGFYEQMNGAIDFFKNNIGELKTGALAKNYRVYWKDGNEENFTLVTTISKEKAIQAVARANMLQPTNITRVEEILK